MRLESLLLSTADGGARGSALCRCYCEQQRGALLATTLTHAWLALPAAEPGQHNGINRANEHNEVPLPAS
jgi:hypothetical protein